MLHVEHRQVRQARDLHGQHAQLQPADEQRFRVRARPELAAILHGDTRSVLEYIDGRTMEFRYVYVELGERRHVAHVHGQLAEAGVVEKIQRVHFDPSTYIAAYMHEQVAADVHLGQRREIHTLGGQLLQSIAAEVQIRETNQLPNLRPHSLELVVVSVEGGECGDGAEQRIDVSDA